MRKTSFELVDLYDMKKQKVDEHINNIYETLHYHENKNRNKISLNVTKTYLLKLHTIFLNMFLFNL